MQLTAANECRDGPGMALCWCLSGCGSWEELRPKKRAGQHCSKSSSRKGKSLQARSTRANRIMRNKRTKANKVMTFAESRAYSIGASKLTPEQMVTRYAELIMNPGINTAAITYNQ